MNPKVLVVGSINMDLVISVDQLPKEGETLLAQAISEVPGGKGANQAAAVGKLRTPVAMIGKVGSDPYADHLLGSLGQAGVNTGHILRSGGRTGLALITVDRSGHNQIVVIPGANNELSAADIESQKQLIEQCEIVVLQLEIPMETVECTLRLAKGMGKITVLNPAPAQSLSNEILQLVDYLIPNEHELESISGIKLTDLSSVHEAAEIFLDKGVKAVIVTLGEKGCCYVDRHRIKMFPAHKVEAKDTTAAGDSFIGGFVAGYLAKRDIDAAIEQAVKVSALTVMRHGAQDSLPTLEEVEHFDHFRI